MSVKDDRQPGIEQVEETPSNIIIVSNMVGDKTIDRIYGSPASGGQLRLINKDFTTYTGNITKKTIIVQGMNNTFKSHVFVTDDDRWFDRCGMPINKPTKELTKEDEEEKTENNI
jgi:hypothetical protein